jgi:hypothetical protein
MALVQCRECHREISSEAPACPLCGAPKLLDAALFNEREYAAAERLWAPNYIQHSTHIEPGRDGLFTSAEQVMESGILFRRQPRDRLPAAHGLSRTTSAASATSW